MQESCIHKHPANNVKYYLQINIKKKTYQALANEMFFQYLQPNLKLNKNNHQNLQQKHHLFPGRMKNHYLLGYTEYNYTIYYNNSKFI